MKKRPPRICIAVSSGGHLTQAKLLEPWWSKYDHFWVTFNKPDAVSTLQNERCYFAFFPTNRNLVNLVRNTFLAIRILYQEKPTIIFSTGAAIAVPFFYLGKLLGAKTIYLEVYDRIDSPTITGRLVHPVTDCFLIQWESQGAFYPKATLIGELM